MPILATASVTSSAAPAAFFERWADTATWPDWNTDTEWVRMDGPFQAGTTGKLKPKGGFAVPFVIARMVPGREFVDVSRLPGARLTFDHQVRTTADGGTRVDVTVALTGPLRAVWRAVLGGGLINSLQSDLDRLQATVDDLRGRIDLTAAPNWGHQLRRGLLPLSDRDLAAVPAAMTDCSPVAEAAAEQVAPLW